MFLSFFFFLSSLFKVLDLSGIRFGTLNASGLTAFGKLQILNVTQCDIESIISVTQLPNNLNDSAVEDKSILNEIPNMYLQLANMSIGNQDEDNTNVTYYTSTIGYEEDSTQESQLHTGKVVPTILNGFILQGVSIIDLSDNPLTLLSQELFMNTPNLYKIFAGNLFICCSEILPENFNPSQCETSEHMVSSCSLMIESKVYQAILFLLAIIGVMSNIGNYHSKSILNYLIVYHKKNNSCKKI